MCASAAIRPSLHTLRLNMTEYGSVTMCDCPV